jgi:RND superfamily putative drug exporter
MFASWGRLVHRFRWVTLFVSLVLLGSTVAALLTVPAPNSNGSVSPPTESARADNLIRAQLTGSSPPTFDLIFSSPSLQTGDAAFRSAMQDALAPLADDARVSGIQTPYTATGGAAAALQSKNGHEAIAVVTLKEDASSARRDYSALRGLVHSDSLTVTATGGLVVSHDFTAYFGQDLTRSSAVVFVVALVLLLVMFGTLVAAGLPLLIAIAAEISGIALGVNLLNRFTDVSQYATDLVALIGLGVAIDYSLFIVSRFREELAAGRSVEDAIANSVATAGRAVVFSGLTVAIGLTGLLFFQGTYVASMGAAGAITMLCAVVWALTFLPALLSVLGPRVDWVRIPLFGRPARPGRGLFHALALAVTRRPLLALAPALLVLLAVAAPVLQLRLGTAGIEGLPPQAPSRVGWDKLQNDFPHQSVNAVPVVVDFGSGSPLSAQNVGYLYDLDRSLAARPGVVGVDGPFADPGLTRDQYVIALSGPAAQLPAANRQALAQSVGPDIAVLTVRDHDPAQSSQAEVLVSSIRGLAPPPGGHLLVTGQTATNADNVGYMLGRAPVAVGFVVIATCLVLFLLLGSVVLPLKAVLMNLLSISAAFGAVTYVFVQGNLSRVLDFTPQPVDPFVLALLFAVIFGLSMDYEVFMLSRIQEHHQCSGDTRAAVAVGLERSGRLISGAAAIMIGVFLPFGGLANTIVIKETGIGLAVAVAVDATVIRILLVPSLMRLLGSVSWWAPAPLARLYRRLGVNERGGAGSTGGDARRAVA